MDNARLFVDCVVLEPSKLLSQCAMLIARDFFLFIDAAPEFKFLIFRFLKKSSFVREKIEKVGNFECRPMTLKLTLKCCHVSYERFLSLSQCILEKSQVVFFVQHHICHHIDPYVV